VNVIVALTGDGSNQIGAIYDATEYRCHQVPLLTQIAGDRVTSVVGRREAETFE
jgi:hypothetical protein